MKKSRRKIKVIERDLSDERIDGSPVWGYWQDVGHGKTEIHLEKSLSGKKNHLIFLLHELLHEARPDFSEKEVDRVSELLGGVVWRKGYRRIGR